MKSPSLKCLGGCNSETEASSEYNSRHLSKDSRKLKKLNWHRPVREMFRTALEYTTYCLVVNYSHHKNQVAKHVTTLVSGLQGSQERTDIWCKWPISIIMFFHPFKMTCDCNKIDEGAAMNLLPYFMMMSAGTTLAVCLSLKAKSTRCSVEERVLMKCYQGVRNLLEMYAKGDIMAQTGSDIALFVKLSNLSPIEVAIELWLETLSCLHFYKE